MFIIPLVVILFQLALQTGGAEALCCDDIRYDVEYRILAYNILCSKYNPRLGTCCRVIELDVRMHQVAYRTLCSNNGKLRAFYM